METSIEWGKTSIYIEMVYYRYVLAFLLYAKGLNMTYRNILEHLRQCQRIGQGTYGISLNRTKDWLGTIGEKDSDSSAFLSWRHFDGVKGEGTREEESQEFRRTRCHLCSGTVVSTHDIMIEICFSLDGSFSTSFLAKAPKTSALVSIMSGQKVRFYLGFSYSGFRAWDVVKDES